MLPRFTAPLLVCVFLAIPCLAQSNGDTTPATPPPAATPAPAPANSAPVPKKVWTNDDIASVKPAVDKRPQAARATPAQGGDPATAERIRKSLEKLQGQLDDVNKKLQAYKDFQNGEPVSTGAREMDKGLSRMPVDQQIVQLQEKKKNLEGQIGDLIDEARKKGIDPGQLR